MKSEALTQRVKVQFTAQQRALLDVQADAAGMTLARYIRECALAAAGGPDAPKRPSVQRSRKHELTFAEVHELAMQVRKVGVNLNQLAHQANAGMVPLKREEVVYIQNRIQILLSEAHAALERAFR